MQIQKIPLFQDAHILRRDMLEALSDYAFLFNRYLYRGYSDGILAGCELTTTSDSIVLNEGILLFKEQPYLIKEPISLNYYPTNKLTILKLTFSEEMWETNFIYREMEMEFSEQKAVEGKEMELCRFTLQEGAQLRYKYQNFEDRNTVYDTLNCVFVPYASKGDSTLAPDIVKNFAEEMLLLPDITDLDMLFCMQVLSQNEPVSKEALRHYLKRSTRKEITDITNEGIYLKLVEVLLKNRGEIQEDEVQKKKWRISI